MRLFNFNHWHKAGLLALLLMVLATLSGCGNKGPLRHPAPHTDTFR